MDRRRFLFLGAAAVVAPLAAEAQPDGKVYRIGVLEVTSPALNAANMNAFRQGLRELGYVEGRNLHLEYRSADGRPERFPALAGELVRQKVDLILTRGTPAVIAAKSTTATIPIVMAASGEPLRSGVIGGLASPGENVTGLSALTAELSGKRLQLLKEALPGLQTIAVLLDTRNRTMATQWRDIELAAKSMALRPQLLDVRKVEELEPAFDAAVAQGAGAMVIAQGTLVQSHIRLVIDLAAKRRMPAAYYSREFVDAGGLMAYGVSYPDLYRRAAAYADKIFRGARPADLPVEQPTKFEMAINLRTARAIGIVIPQSLLLRADHIIQ